MYSDVYCSNNATLAELDQCADPGSSLKIRSFSIDGCVVPFSESGNTSTTTVTSTESHRRGLSSAAKAGLGVGVSCGVLLLVAVAWIIWLKLGRSKARSPEPDDSQGHLEEPKELSGEQIFELNSARGSEMPAEKERQEMAAEPVSELRSKSSLRIVLPELEGDHP